MSHRSAARLGRLSAHVSGGDMCSSSRGVVGSARASSDAIEDCSFVSALDGTEQRFVVIWPAERDRAASSLPPPCDVLIALHGHGSDRWQFVENARGECAGARDFAATHGMVYVSPDYRAPTNWMGPEAEADLVQIIHLLREELVPNVGRVILTGGSMGVSLQAIRRCS